MQRKFICRTFVPDNQSGYQKQTNNNFMNNQQKAETYLMQSVCLSNYAKLCVKLNEVPRMDLVLMISNCEDVKKLIETNKFILSKLN